MSSLPQTRSQQDLKCAAAAINEAQGLPKEAMEIYTGLCNSFPVLVRTCGLCQALAFSTSKAAGTDDRAKAHRLLVEHVGTLVGRNDDLLDYVQRCSSDEYLQFTVRVLDAWIYFKRLTEARRVAERQQPASESEAQAAADERLQGGS